MDIQRRLARNLVRLRERHGWSQEDLADASGLHRTYISGLARQVRNPTSKSVTCPGVTQGCRAVCPKKTGSNIAMQ